MIHAFWSDAFHVFHPVNGGMVGPSCLQISFVTLDRMIACAADDSGASQKPSKNEAAPEAGSKAATEAGEYLLRSVQRGFQASEVLAWSIATRVLLFPDCEQQTASHF